MFKLLKYFNLKQWILLALIIVFIVLQAFCDVTVPSYTEQIIKQVQAGESSAAILKTGGVMLIFCAGAILATIAITILTSIVSSTYSKNLRRRIYEKVGGFSMEESDKFTTASLITRCTNDVQQVTGATMMMIRIGIAAPILAVMAILKIFTSSSELTFTTAVGVVFMIAAILAILMSLAPQFKKIQKLTDKLNGVTREKLTGIKVIRAFNAESTVDRKFEDVNTDLTKTNLFVGRVQSLMSPVMMIVNYGITLSIYWLGSFIILRDNAPDFFASMFAFTQLSGQVVMAFMMMTMLLLMFPRAQVSGKRIAEVLNTVSKIKDPPNVRDFITDGEIEFKDVSFAYSGAEKPVLENVSFKINKGETAAIVGLTGAGKTSLVNLVPRFYDVTDGQVLVNGVDIKDVKQETLRSVIGYVPQKSLLFSGSVSNNIAYGNMSADAELIETAAKVACADEFIEEMPDKYDSIISQGGKNLSGGQKQRLSIARAVAFKPQIYIFDDSFSALDYKTDLKVRQNIKAYAADATKIIVAQRIGTIMDADKIIVLDGGKVAGIGTHKELLETCPLYLGIAKSQLSEKELEL